MQKYIIANGVFDQRSPCSMACVHRQGVTLSFCHELGPCRYRVCTKSKQGLTGFYENSVCVGVFVCVTVKTSVCVRACVRARARVCVCVTVKTSCVGVCESVCVVLCVCVCVRVTVKTSYKQKQFPGRVCGQMYWNLREKPGYLLQSE